MSGHTLVVDGRMSASFGAPRWSDELIGTFAQIIPDGPRRPIAAPG